MLGITQSQERARPRLVVHATINGAFFCCIFAGINKNQVTVLRDAQHTVTYQTYVWLLHDAGGCWNQLVHLRRSTGYLSKHIR